MSHPWRNATAVAIEERRPRTPKNHRIISEYEDFFSRPVGSHIDIQPEDLNRWYVRNNNGQMVPFPAFAKNRNLYTP